MAKRPEHKKTVLMIEDDELLAKMYQTKLTMAGLKVVLAHSADHASEALKAHRPDLVILDILLPKVNGFAILKNLRKHPETMDCPVIILTNLTGSEVDMSEEMAEALGVVDYLVKSKVTPDKVLRSVLAALGEHS